METLVVDPKLFGLDATWSAFTGFARVLGAAARFGLTPGRLDRSLAADAATSCRVACSLLGELRTFGLEALEVQHRQVLTGPSGSLQSAAVTLAVDPAFLAFPGLRLAAQDLLQHFRAGSLDGPALNRTQRAVSLVSEAGEEPREAVEFDAAGMSCEELRQSFHLALVANPRVQLKLTSRRFELVKLLETSPSGEWPKLVDRMLRYTNASQIQHTPLLFSLLEKGLLHHD